MLDTLEVKSRYVRNESIRSIQVRRPCPLLDTSGKMTSFPKAPRTQISGHLGPKTILFRASSLF